MVFQKPNPFPKSIYDNIAFGPKIAGFKGNMDELVEESLRRAALWDEVKDKLKESGLALSGGQQQRLCIARAIATRPDVILMDEPCSALDPIATQRIEDLMQELVSDYTIVIVTHNMQQAARVSDRTAFFTVEVSTRPVTARGRSWSTTRPRRSSRTRATDGRRTTSRGGSDDARPHFHEELEQMELELLTLGELAGRAVQQAVEARARARRRAGRSGDRRATTRSTSSTSSSTRGCSSLLALQAPVAADLRLVSVIMHSSLHLERIGDQAVNVAKITWLTRDLPSNATIVQQIGEMGDIVVEMVRTAMDALAAPRPGARACGCRRWTTRSTGSTGNMHFEVAKLADDPKALEWGMHMNLAARALERVGDNAVDIGEQVAFLLSGEFREFTDASHPGDVVADGD